MTKNIRFRAFLLISAKKAKKRETVFIQINRKTGSWILYMYYLIHSGTCWDKKISKKTTSTRTFRLGRKMGRNGCRPWKCPKCKKENFSSSWLLCRKLIAYIRNFDRALTQQPGLAMRNGRKKLSLILKLDPAPTALRECVDSGEDASVNAVWSLRNWRGNMHRRAEGPEVRIAPPISKTEDRIHRCVRARVNAFTLCW